MIYLCGIIWGLKGDDYNIMKSKAFKSTTLKAFCIFLKNIFYVGSVTTVTLLLSNIGTGKQRLFSIILSFIIGCFATFGLNILPKIFKEKNKLHSLLSIFFAVSTSFYIAQEFYRYNIFTGPLKIFFKSTTIPHSLIMFFLILGSLYALYSFYYYFISRLLPRATSFFNNLEKNEKYYLYISTIIFGLCIIIIYSITNVFYSPKINQEIQAFDVIYSSDTGAHAILNDYLNINAVENDLRQPLFAVFTFPFAIIAYMIGNLFNTFGNGYFILLAIIQVFLLNICCIILGKLLNLRGFEKTLFLIFYTVTYPFILFVFNLEQYVFGLFWLLCFLFSTTQNKKGNKFYFIASIGSLITNGFVFPLLTSGKKIKEWFIDFFNTGIAFICGIIIFGQFPVILNIFAGVNHLSSFVSTRVNFNTLCQYTHFIENCFIAPFNTTTKVLFQHISYQLASYNSFSILGCMLFLFIIISFIINRKNNFAKICMSWVIFSIILLVVLGYGTSENGLILYSLYFSWAFVSLLFLLLKKILHRKPKVFICIFIILITIILALNINGLLDLVQFGLNNFDIVR